VTLQGKWRIVELPGYEADYPDMMGPAYILLKPTGGEFAFGCVTGAFAGGGNHHAAQFEWDGNDEMDEAHGCGWADLQPDGSLRGEIKIHNGDDIGFIARRRPTSSTAC
jgi:hypothetical protein